MIDREYGEYFLVCDVCDEESEECWDTFQDAIDGRKELGWKSKKTSKGWKDVCPNCIITDGSVGDKQKDRHEMAIEYFNGYGSPYDEMIIKALKKQVPMHKCFDDIDTYSCPNCEEEMESDEQYCVHCGQHTWTK